MRLAHDPGASRMLSWLDDHTEWDDGEATRRVAQFLRSSHARQPTTRTGAFSQVTRGSVAAALAEFYGETDRYRPYLVTCAGTTVDTRVLTRRDWLDLALPLGRERDRLELATDRNDAAPLIDGAAAEAAVERIGRAVTADGRLINAPLYRLRRVDFTDNTMTDEVGLTTFLTYALTLDLPEGELANAIAGGGTIAGLPLRRRYLPDLASVADIDRRICAGGPLALFAAARPGSRSLAAPTTPSWYTNALRKRSRGIDVSRSSRRRFINHWWTSPTTRRSRPRWSASWRKSCSAGGKPALNWLYLVGDTGIEPATSSVSVPKRIRGNAFRLALTA